MQFAGGGFVHQLSAWILPALAGIVALAFSIRFARANRDGRIGSTLALAHFAASFAAIATFTAAAFLHRNAWTAFEALGGGQFMFLSVFQDLTRFSRNGLAFYFVALVAAIVVHRFGSRADGTQVAGIPASVAAFATAGCILLAGLDRELREFPLAMAVPAFAKFRSPDFLPVADRLFGLMTAAQALGTFFTLSLFVFLLFALRRYRGLDSSRFAVVTSAITAVLLLLFVVLLEYQTVLLGKLATSGNLPPSW